MTMRAQVGQIKRRPMRIRAGVIILAAAGLLAASQAASAAPKDRARVLDHATQEPVRGAFSMLERSDRGIETRLRTRSRPGPCISPRDPIILVAFRPPAHPRHHGR